MSVWAPWSRDPQKDKKILQDIEGVLQSHENGEKWEEKSQKIAKELFDTLSNQLIVHKDEWTKEQLEKMRDLLDKIQDLNKNSKGASMVINNDIQMINDRIALLDHIGNPPSEFHLPPSGFFDLKTNISIPDKLLWRFEGWSFMYWETVINPQENEKMNSMEMIIEGKKLRITRHVDAAWKPDARITVHPMNILKKPLSFDLILSFPSWNEWWGIEMKRKLIVYPHQEPVQKSATEMVNQLLWNDEEIDPMSDNEWIRIANQYFAYWQWSMEESANTYDYGSEKNLKNYAEIVWEREKTGKKEQLEKKVEEMMEKFQKQMNGIWFKESDISRFWNHKSWIYWHLAKQEYIFRNRDRMSQDPVYWKYDEFKWAAFEENEKNDQFMIDTMIGFELRQKCLVEIGESVYIKSEFHNTWLWKIIANAPDSSEKESLEKIIRIFHEKNRNYANISSLDFGMLWTYMRKLFAKFPDIEVSLWEGEEKDDWVKLTEKNEVVVESVQTVDDLFALLWFTDEERVLLSAEDKKEMNAKLAIKGDDAFNLKMREWFKKSLEKKRDAFRAGKGWTPRTASSVLVETDSEELIQQKNIFIEWKKIRARREKMWINKKDLLALSLEELLILEMMIEDWTDSEFVEAKKYFDLIKKKKNSVDSWTSESEFALFSEEWMTEEFSNKDRSFDEERADIDKKIKVSIWNVETFYDDQARRYADEELRKIHASHGKFQLFDPKSRSPSKRKPRERAKLFIMRDIKRQKLIEEYKGKFEKQWVSLLNSEMVNAVDRFEKMNELFGDDAIDREFSDYEIAEVNTLSSWYITWLWVTDDATFEKQFYEIVKNNEYVRGHLSSRYHDEFKFLAWNILLKLKSQRAYYQYIVASERIVQSFSVHWNRELYDAEMRKAIDTYIKATGQAVSSDMKILLSGKKEAKEMLEWLKYEKGKQVAKAKNVRIWIQLLTWWEAAHEINNTDKDESIAAKIWHFTQKHPVYASIAKLALVWSGIFMSPWAAALMSMWVIWWTVWTRKYSDSTKEQKSYEENMAKDFENKTKEIERQEEIYQHPERFWIKYPRLNPTRYKARRNTRLYKETTQDMRDIDEMILLLEKWQLSKKDLEEIMPDVLARIDIHQSSGHNFYAQKDVKVLEEKMNRLYSLLLSSVQSIWTDIDTIRVTEQYTRAYESMSNEYTTKLDLFKERRFNLALRYTSATIATSLAIQWYFDTWLFRKCTNTVITECVPKEKIVQQMHEEIIWTFWLSATEQSQIETLLATPPSGWWCMTLREATKSVVMKRPWMTEAAYISMEQYFMENNAWRMMDKGVWELLSNASWLPLTPSWISYDKTMASLVKKWIAFKSEWPDIIKAIVAENTTQWSIMSFPPKLRRQAWEFVYHYIEGCSTDPTISPLVLSSYYDKVVGTECETVVRDVLNCDRTLIQKLVDIASWLWVPLFANTFYTPVDAKKKGIIVDPPQPKSKWMPHIIVDPKKVSSWEIMDMDADAYFHKDA